MNWQAAIKEIIAGDIKTLARVISLIENEITGYDKLLQLLPACEKKVIGITGPPGAGKSTLVDALIEVFVAQNKRAGILCVDPSSPFNHGALLGDRIRMNRWGTHPNVFIRSLATRGSLGGLNPKIIEITDILKTAPFDHIIIETVGVGQSEVEIAGLADTTLVVLVPESGDEIQNMKSGLMEIADIFVVNKADRPGADQFANNLRALLLPEFRKTKKNTAIVKTVAATQTGITELIEKIEEQQKETLNTEKKYWLLAEKAYQLIQQKRMKNISREHLAKAISSLYREKDFNLYRFVKTFTDEPA